MSSSCSSADPAFGAEVAHLGGRPVVVVRGDVDLGVADGLWSCVERACDAGGPVVLDCSQVTFMDSAGIHVLVRAYQRMGCLPGTVVVRDPSAEVRAVLELSGLGDVVTVQRGDPADVDHPAPHGAGTGP